MQAFTETLRSFKNSKINCSYLRKSTRIITRTLGSEERLTIRTEDQKGFHSARGTEDRKHRAPDTRFVIQCRF